MSEFNYGDYFGQNWATEGKYRVTFYGVCGWLGEMILSAGDKAAAVLAAADFNKRFALFPDTGSKTRLPVHIEAERIGE